MSDNLDKVLVETVTKINSASSEIYSGIKTAGLKAIDVAYEQVPELINQFLMWKLAEATFYASLGIIVIGLLFFFLKKVHKRAKDNFDGEMLLVAYWVFGIGLLGGFSLITAVNAIREILFITLAPKIYLLEYLSSLIK